MLLSPSPTYSKPLLTKPVVLNAVLPSSDTRISLGLMLPGYFAVPTPDPGSRAMTLFPKTASLLGVVA
jgi:hypothetical protein